MFIISYLAQGELGVERLEADKRRNKYRSFSNSYMKVREWLEAGLLDKK